MTKDDLKAETVTSPAPRQSTGGGSSTEFEPPLACVRRMLKNTLPTNTNVGKDACSAFSRACGIFIVYLTACANDFARENKRQTITANDIISAVEELDFGEFAPLLTGFIEKHRKNEKIKKEAKRRNEEAANNAKIDADDDQSQADDMESSRTKRRKVEDTREDGGAPEDLMDMNDEIMDDGEESLADASQDDNDSHANLADQDERDFGEDDDDQDENE